MDVNENVAGVLRGLRDQHGLPPTGGTDECPVFGGTIPDGQYDITLDSETVRVSAEGGRLHLPPHLIGTTAQ